MGTAGSGRPRAKRWYPTRETDRRTSVTKIGSGTVGGPSRFASFALLVHSARRTEKQLRGISSRTLPLQVSPSSPIFLLVLGSFLLSSPFQRRCFSIFLRPASSSSLLRRVHVPSFLPPSSHNTLGVLSRSYVRRSAIFLSFSPSNLPFLPTYATVRGTSPRLPTHNQQATIGHAARRKRLQRGVRATDEITRVIRCLVELLRRDELPRHGQTEESKGHRSDLYHRPTSPFSSHRAPSPAESSSAPIHDPRGATPASASHTPRRPNRRSTPRILGLGRILSVTPWVVTSRPTIPVAR